MLYLFYGPDEFARSERLAAMRAAYPPDLHDLNATSLDGKRLRLDDLAQACEALPFLAERRLVVVTDALKQSKAGKEREELRDYLQRVPATCDLVFVERGDVDKRNSIFTYLKQAGSAEEFLPRKGADLQRWLNERARLLDARLDSAAAQRLIDYVGSDSRSLVTELTRLATYVGRGGRITAAIIDAQVQDTQEQNLFAFIDDLALRRSGAALRGLRRLLADGQAATYLLFMIMRQVRILLGVQELANQRPRPRPDDIAAQLGQKPFVVRKALEQARGFGPGELVALHDQLLATDQAIKTGRLQAEVALELLVVDFCGVATPTGASLPPHSPG